MTASNKKEKYVAQTILGVVFPILAASIELTTGICRNTFFDPLPNIWSCLVFALIPIGNAMVLYGLAHPTEKSLSRLMLANGISIGVSAYFSLTFVTLLPVSMLASLIGIGLCGLTPFFALVCACRLRTRLLAMRGKYEISSPERLGSLGGIAGFLLLLPIGLSALTTDVALNWIENGNVEFREKGIHWLENYGSKSVLAHLAAGRRLGYYTWGSSYGLFDDWNRRSSVTPELLYRLTGRSFPQLDQPTWRSGRPLWNPFKIYTPTPRRGTEGLSLSESVIDGWADGDGVVGYLEWTMVVRNDGPRTQEAVSTIQLPKGATVSRVTLWVNGEEREAAFAAKAKVTEAYQRVVRRKRDPILITTDGLDRIQVRCFPVLPRDHMRFRIGISLPLELESPTRAVLPLPFFVDRNFSLPDKTRHHLWIESRGTLDLPGKNVAASLTREGKNRLEVRISGSELPNIASAIKVSRQDISTVWNAWDENELPVVGTLKNTVTGHQPAVVVLDGSWAMRSRWDEVLGLLENASHVRQVFLADKDVQEFEFDTPESRTRTLQFLRQFKPNRGRDNVTALRAAWSTASRTADSRIIWIHAPQPYALSTIATLWRPFNRSDAPGLIDAPMMVGPNVVVDELPQLKNVHSVPLIGNDSSNFWKRVAQIDTLPFELAQGSPPVHAYQASRHLTRIWALQHIHQQLDKGREWDDLVPIAEHYRIVSPVSGAVVLETNAQYRQAGLQAPKNNLPQTATPATLLLLVGLVLLASGGLLTRYRVHA